MSEKKTSSNTKPISVSGDLKRALFAKKEKPENSRSNSEIIPNPVAEKKTSSNTKLPRVSGELKRALFAKKEKPDSSDDE